MAEHADAAGELTAPTEIDENPGAQSSSGETDAAGGDCRRSRLRWGTSCTVVGIVVVIVALGALAGWQTMRWRQQEADHVARAELVDAASQGAVALTTIDAASIDADVQRILDASTGSFRDDFADRSTPFVDVVRRAQSKTEGTVTAAGIESVEGTQAKVLVTVTVRTTNGGQPEAEPRSWRMRISMDQGESGAKMSDVQFVP